MNCGRQQFLKAATLRTIFRLPAQRACNFSVIREAFGEEGWCNNSPLRHPKTTLSFSTLYAYDGVDADMRIDLARRILETVFLLFARRSEGLVNSHDIFLCVIRLSKK